MKLLLITSTFPTPTAPRQGAFNQVLVEALREMHDVRVIAPTPWPQALRKVFSRAATSSVAGVSHPTYYYPPKLLRAQYHHFYWQSISPVLRRWKKEFTPDVVLGYWLHPDGAAAVRAAEQLGVPSVVMSGGTDLRLLPRDERRRSAVANVLQRADRLVVFSRELSTRAQALGIPAEKIDVVYRGVNRTCFYPGNQAAARQATSLDPEDVVIFWAGRLEQVKNPQLLLEASVSWKRKWGARLRVIMAGDGPLRKQLQEQRHRLGLEGHVSLIGNLTQRELSLHYNAADVTVLTSHSEGTPNVLLESIACGTPFVATDVGGVSEIASPQLDRLVCPDNQAELAAAVINRLQTLPTGKRLFEPTDMQGMAATFSAILSRVTGNEESRQVSFRPTTSSPGGGPGGEGRLRIRLLQPDR